MKQASLIRYRLRYRLLAHAALGLSVVLLAGCGGSAYPLAGVSGVVTLDGEPLAGARVAFQPRREGEGLNSGPGSYGTTDAQGRYTLRTIDGAHGAVVATHDVSISTYVGDADPTTDSPKTLAPERVPARYREPDALTFTVPPEGAAAADFHLRTASGGQ